MNNISTRENTVTESRFSAEIAAKAALKMKARRIHAASVWSGLGVTGMIGWSVAAPMLIGIALGRWIDGKHWSNHSWTLALLGVGLVLGCVNAWHWVVKEDREQRMELEEAGD